MEKTLASSGFTAALVDVVLHKGDDLLEFVVQLSAARGGVGLESAHHLGENTIKITFIGFGAGRSERCRVTKPKFSRRHTCIHNTNALHMFTKLTSAVLFMPNSCHCVSGIYGLLAAMCNQAERAEPGCENRQSGTIHRAL